MARYDLFISYSRHDEGVVKPFAERLRGAGLNVYLDRWHAKPGTPWLPALEAALAGSSAVAVFVGNELGAWQQREKDAALQRQARAAAAGDEFPVIPVLLGRDAAPLGFLDQNTWVDMSPGHEDEALAILVKAARGEAPGPELADATAAAKATVCPYRGLLYFREEDAALFHGRTTAVASLLDLVDEYSLVAVVGDSGSGKSSVVRAGLLPALRSRRDQPWEMLTMVPGDRPFHRLAAQLSPVLDPELSEADRLEEVGKLAANLAKGSTRLRDVVESVLQRQTGTQRLLLVVDQWEELFTLTSSEAERIAFIDHLLEATDKTPLKVVVTLRGDYFGRAVTRQRNLADRLQGAQLNLGPMTRDELQAAITEPARQVGLQFEANLADLILEHATAEPGNLPLLEFALRELWELSQGSGDRRLLRREAYDAMGQLKGAIAQRADAAFQRLTLRDASAEPRLRSIFLRLVRPGQGQADTRQRASLSEFDAAGRHLVEQLAGERLLVTAGLGTGPDGDGDGATVEVAHEALIRHWERLKQWVDQRRDFMVWRVRMDDAMGEWQRQGRPRGALLSGIPLAEARGWLKTQRADLSAREIGFVKASTRRRTVLLIGLGSFAVLATAGILASAVSARDRGRADTARERAEALVEYMVFDLRDLLAPVGRLELMEGINARVDAYYQQLGDDGSDKVQRRRSAALTNQGDSHVAAGRLDAARKAYYQSLAIRERLGKADATNTGWQRDLSVSYDRLGDVEVAAGRLDAARKAYEQSLAIRERLTKADASNTEWHRDLSVSYIKLGNIEVAAGRLDVARKAYEQSLAMAERLAKSDASNTGWQRDLSVSYINLGNVEVGAGQLDAARKAYEQSLAIAERLAKADATNTKWQRDLSASYEGLGDVEMEAGRLDAARTAYEQSLAIAERLAKADATNAGWQRDLSVSYLKLGNVIAAASRPSVSYLKLGNVIAAASPPAEALTLFGKSLEISSRLAQLDPANAVWKKDLAYVQQRLAEVQAKQPAR